DPQAYISLEKYNSYFVDDRLDLPDISSLLTDGAWHEVIVDLPLAPGNYHNWDGYASQIRVITSYSAGATPCNILFDGWEIQALDAGRVTNLTTTNDYTYVENGTLYIEGDAVVERIFEGCEGWYYGYIGTGQIDFLIDGSWEVAPPPGDPVYEYLGGFRLYGGSFEYIQINALPPLVRIDSPSYDSIVAGNVLVEVSASDISGITSVAFSIDGVGTFTDYAAPYEWLWNTGAGSDGVHLLNVSATSNNGSVNYDYCYVTVDNTKPVTTIDQPGYGAVVNNTRRIIATASDVSGIASVEFYLEGVLLFADDSAPYEYMWDTTTVSDGEKNITCAAVDTVGNTGYSSILVTVDNSAPQLSIHSLSVWGNSGLMAVNTSDPSGIHRVEFYIDGFLQYVDYSYPFQWSWSGVSFSDGIYTFMAYSYDNLNHSSSASSGVQIDNTKPDLSVTWTPSGTELSDLVSFSVAASDSNGVAYVEFYLDGVLQETDYSAPYSWSWDTALVLDGNHTIEVIAVDNMANSKSLTIGLNVDNTGPIIFVNNPANQTILAGPSTVWVQASVQDTSIIDTVLLSYNTGGSWISIEMTPSGSHFEVTTPTFPQGSVVLLRIYANDTFGNSNLSETYTCNVVDLSPPSVDIELTPSTLTVSDRVQISVSVTDDSPISMVIIYIDGSPMVWLSSAPYSWSWDSSVLGDGSHTVMAWANDTMNNSGFSETPVTTDNTGPSVVINSPWDATIFSGPYSISVLATAIDTAGIDVVLLSYNAGTGWINTSMTISGNQYEGIIPALQPGDIVDVRIFANDTLGNTAWSVTNSYSIIDDTNPSITVNLIPSISPISGNLHIEAIASDLSGISTVIFYVDGIPVASDNIAPFELTLDTISLIDGIHVLKVWTNDTWDNSNFVEQSITTDNTGPLLVINSPLNSTIFGGPTSITVLATALDTVGINTVLLSYNSGFGWTNITMTINGNLYEGIITGLLPGDTVSVQVFTNDTLGNTAKSSINMYHVIDNTPPSLSIMLTPDIAVYKGSIQIETSVSDISGISKVIFYVDGVPVSTDGVAPYEYLLDTSGLIDGAHTIRVWVNDTWDNSYYEEVAITTDNTGPQITLNSPLNASTFEGPCSISVLVTTLDTTALDSIILRYNSGSGWSTTIMSPNGNQYEGVIVGLLPGDVVEVQVYANDTLGNEKWSTTNVYFVVDGTSPSLMVDLTPDIPIYRGILHVEVTASDVSGISMVVFSVDGIP
ncbi:MAG: Ig-like domain-containing protein, partial [Promethearchaeota archaeon]